MGNRCHDRHSGRFISRSRGRVQAVEGIADIPDEDYALDEAAMKILEAGIALAVKEGWVPPTGSEVRS